MNTQFLFDNMIIIPLLAIVAGVTYLIQFCSVISPCNIEFDEDSKSEMHMMNRYNMLSDNAFTIYISVVAAGVFAALIMSLGVLFIALMIGQIIYMIFIVMIMLFMYDRSRKYWEAYQLYREKQYKSHRTEALTIGAMEIYN